jgi:hypothetical protein
MGRRRIRGRIFLDAWVTGSEPGINLEGSKAGPRQGFDSCHHAAHYRADLTSPPEKMRLKMGRRRIRGRIFLDAWVTGSEPGINLEGSKAGPRQGFDSCPRVTESGTTRDALILGQGLSHALEAPQDVFEAKREGQRRNPLRGRHRTLESHRKESRSTRLLFGILESASVAASRLLSNGARAHT